MSPRGRRSAVHDADGNLVSLSREWGCSPPSCATLSTDLYEQRSIIFDYANRVQQVTVTNPWASAGLLTEYRYDAQDRRTVTLKSNERRLVYDQSGSILLEYEAIPGAFRVGPLAPGPVILPVARHRFYARELSLSLGIRDNTGAYFSHFHDALGRLRLVLDGQGQVGEKYDYYPFGMDRIGKPGGIERLRIRDRERDFGTGLDHFGEREYDPELGRFQSLDPAIVDVLSRGATYDPRTVGAYSFAKNNPLLYDDANGKNAFIWVAARLVSALGGPAGLAIGVGATATALYLSSPAGRAALQQATAQIQGGIQWLESTRRDKGPESNTDGGTDGGEAVQGQEGEAQATKGLADAIAEAEKGGIVSETDRVRNVDKKATSESATKTFEKLAKDLGKEEQTAEDGTKYIDLPNGGTASVRSKSKTGPPTIQINPPGKKVTKIRFSRE